MSLASIRDRIKALLVQADPDAQVHDYERWSTDPQTVLDLFKASLATDQHLHAWVFKPITCTTMHDTQESDLVSYIFLFRFIYSLTDADASEQQAWIYLEQVRQLFRNHPSLNEMVELAAAADEGPMRGKPGLQIEKVDLLTFAGVLCHYGEARMAVAEQVPIGG
jgi:hypothetical protein